MVNTATRIVLFLSSYAPLFGIFALREWHKSRSTALIFLALTVISLVVLALFLQAARQRAATTVEIGTVSSLAGDSMSYLFTYLLPFLNLDLSDAHALASIAVFFTIIAVIYVRSNMIYINPVLSMLDWHIFRVTTEYGTEVALLTRKSHVVGNQTITAVRIGNYLLFDRER